MRPTPRHIRIFLSSPGDVPNERALALQVIDQLPYDPLLRGTITLEVVAWDKPGAGTPLLATLTPQEAINRGLPRPSECDIAVVILWSRLGTPLPEEYVKPEPYRFPTGTALPDGRYLSGTEWEYVDAMQVSRKTGLPHVVIYRRMETPVLKMDDPDFDTKRGQWKLVNTFFATFTNPDGSIRQGYNPYATPDEFRAQFDTHLRSLVQRVLEKPAAVPMSSITVDPPLWTGSPFPGLRAFTPADAPIFFGRGRETDDLVKRLSDPAARFLAVVGASGSGKSSLVGAGLIPRLLENTVPGSKDWRWVRFTPDELGTGDPFAAFAAALRELGALDRAVVARLHDDPAALDALCRAALDGAPDHVELLLFIDQFEELFTSVQPDHRAAFVTLLARMAQTARLRVVATMRADFYARCVDWPDLTDLLKTGSYPLAAPGLFALGEMITRPAARAGLHFEDGLPDRILADTGSEPGALALLAYTLDELYHACTDGGGCTLSHQAYADLGGVERAIGTRADKVFRGLDTEAQAALTQVFRSLITVDDDGTATRQRAPQNRVIANDTARRLVEAFAGEKARLLVTSRGQDNTPLIEVAHEALLRSWPRLAGWIADTKDDHSLLRQMRIAAEQWHAHGETDAFRWPDERLQPVYKALDNLGLDPQADLSAVERAFIRPEFDRLLEELDDPDTSHQRRNIIGERLDVLGDGGRGTGRRGVGLRPDGLPDIVWCAVPGGEITLEDTAETFPVAPFYIAKYPVTYAQFQAFVDDPEGFGQDRWWNGLEKEYRKKEVDTQNFSGSNRPRDSVSWFQAVAFCHWLTATLPPEAWPEEALIPSPSAPSRGIGRLFGRTQPAAQWELRLPTEWEWQQAATGGDPARDYPWGPGWDGRFANTTECGLSRTTAVGMYPAGAAPGGALDMAGNVYEWCLNEYGTPANTGLGGTDNRVVRGGSWFVTLNRARCAFRFGWDYLYRYDFLGFRVVCASPISMIR